MYKGINFTDISMKQESHRAYGTAVSGVVTSLIYMLYYDKHRSRKSAHVRFTEDRLHKQCCANSCAKNDCNRTGSVT